MANLTGSADTTKFDPGGGSAPTTTSPTADTAGLPLTKRLNTIPLTPEQINQWFVDIDAAEKRTKDQSVKWDILLKEYTPSIKAGGTGEDVKANSHFRNVHTKMGQMFVQSPEVQFVAEGPVLDQILVPDPSVPGGQRPASAEEVVHIKQHVVNKELGPDRIDILNVMDECCFDIMAWAGIACVKVGFTVVLRTTQQPVMGPDPNYMPPPSPGGILGLAPQPPPPQVPQIDPTTGQPATKSVEIPIFSEWYAKRFSPKKLLANVDLSSSNFDKEATFVGMKFFMGKRQAMRQFGLTEEELGSNGATDKDKATYTEDESGAANDLVEGYELTYKASCYTDEIHPQVMNQLILLKNVKDRTIVSRVSPDQTIDPATGQLTPDSLIGFPIKVGSNRTMADTPFVISDSGFTNSQAKYLDTHRRQSVKLRDAQIGKYLYDIDAFEDDDIESMKNGSVGDFIGVAANKMANGSDKIFASTAKIQGSQDDYRMAQIIKSDMDETLGINANLAGTETEGIRSATETQAFQAGSAGRMDKEKARIMAFYLSIVRAVDTLITRYATGDNYIAIEGEDGAKRIAMWNRKLLMAGVYGYSIRPDSQLKNDVARDRQQKLSFYNLTAADPLVNRTLILRDLGRDFGYDPAKLIMSPQAQMAQPPHGGAAAGGGPVDKHELENSGGKPNAPGAGNRQERNPRPGAGTEGVVK